MQPGITQEPTPTDAFRMKAGRLYHKWKGREEYFYNDITEVDFRRYASGHMLFVLSSADSASGYVVIAGSNDWRVLQVQCKL